VFPDGSVVVIENRPENPLTLTIVVNWIAQQR